MRQSKRLALVKVTLAVIFWGASFVGTKIALREVSPSTVVWLRFGIGVLILGGAVLIRGQFALPPRREIPYLVLLGFLGIALHQGLQSNALLTSKATTSAWIVATTPVFIALLSWLFLKEQLSPTRVLGIILAGLGVLLVVTGGDLGSLELGAFGAPGDILVVLSAVNWAVFTVLSRRGLSRYPASLMMLYVMLIGWLFTSVPFLAGGAGLADIRSLSITGWVGIGFLGIFCSGFAYIFWFDALKLVPASQVGAFLYFEPLVTILVAALLLQEPLRVAVAFGGAIILLGVWMVNRSRATVPRAVLTAEPNKNAA